MNTRLQRSRIIMLILLPSATSELLQSASRQASIGEQQPLRTGDAHRGRTCLSLTHVCCEDPKRIKVGTSAKLPQPASYKVRPRLGKAPMTIPVGPTCAPPSPKSAILRILGVEPSVAVRRARDQLPSISALGNIPVVSHTDRSPN
jgi:hypothetical protein